MSEHLARDTGLTHYGDRDIARSVAYRYRPLTDNGDPQ